MARGGYRPNSGPKKGTKYRPRGSKKEKPTDIAQDILDDAAAANKTPLEYMIGVMNDPQADKDRRDRMAIAAAPFVHARKSDGVGKKDEKADRAKKAGGGKFAPSSPPVLKVVGRE